MIVCQRLVQEFDSKKKSSADGAKTKDITQKIMGCIRLDDQPFSVAEDTGFQQIQLSNSMHRMYSWEKIQESQFICIPCIGNSYCINTTII